MEAVYVVMQYHVPAGEDEGDIVDGLKLGVYSSLEKAQAGVKALVEEYSYISGNVEYTPQGAARLYYDNGSYTLFDIDRSTVQ